MKKAELEAKVKELTAKLEETEGQQIMANTKKAEATATTNAKEFNAFDYVKTLLVIANERKENEIRMRQTNQGVLNWLQKVGAISSYEIFISDTFIDEEGKHYVLAKVEDINLNAKSISKAGKEFNVFNYYTIGKGVALAHRK